VWYLSFLLCFPILVQAKPGMFRHWTLIYGLPISITNPDGRIRKSDTADTHPNERDVTKYVSRVALIYHLTAFGSSFLAFLFCFRISKGSQH
jgi:hypothetical protein